MENFRYPFEPEFKPPPPLDFAIQSQPSECPECEKGKMEFKRKIKGHKKYVCIRCGAVEIKK